MKSDWHDLRPGDFVILEIRSMEKDDDDNHIIEFCESTPTNEDWPDALVFKKNFPVEVADPQWLKKDPSIALDEMEKERDAALDKLSAMEQAYNGAKAGREIAVADLSQSQAQVHTLTEERDALKIQLDAIHVQDGISIEIRKHELATIGPEAQGTIQRLTAERDIEREHNLITAKVLDYIIFVLTCERPPSPDLCEHAQQAADRIVTERDRLRADRDAKVRECSNKTDLCAKLINDNGVLVKKLGEAAELLACAKDTIGAADELNDEDKDLLNSVRDFIKAVKP